MAARQDVGLGGHERMRFQQIARRIEAAAQDLEAQQVIVGGHLNGQLVARPELQPVQLRQREVHDLGGAGVVAAVCDEIGAQQQEFHEEEAVRRNRLEQRVSGSQHPQRTLGIMVLQKLADDPDEEPSRVRAARTDQGKGGDERLVEMVARCLEIRNPPRSSRGEQLQLREQERILGGRGGFGDAARGKELGGLSR